MKPTSVIFIILAIVLIVAGTVTCVAAQKMADANDVRLFYHEMDEVGNGIETSEFSSESVNKIKIELKKADVIINIGGESASMKLVNFSKNTYENSITNKNLTISDSFNIMSVFNILTSGFEFEGLRHYLHFDQFSERNKILEITLPQNSDIKQFEIQLGSGSITFTGINNQADYTLKVGEGNIDMSSIRLISSVNAKIGTGNFSIDSAAQNGNINVEITEGNFYGLLRRSEYRSYSLTALGGEIDYFGEIKVINHEVEPLAPTSSLTVKITAGNIKLAGGEDARGSAPDPASL